jgi:hypothetical protein
MKRHSNTRNGDRSEKSGDKIDRMLAGLPGPTGVNGIRLPIRGGERGGTRAPGLRAFSSLARAQWGDAPRSSLLSTSDLLLRSVRSEPQSAKRAVPSSVESVDLLKTQLDAARSQSMRSSLGMRTMGDCRRSWHC